jgi:hypothetical protein
LPVAVNWSVAPAATEPVAAVTVIEVSVTTGGGVLVLSELPPPPQAERQSMSVASATWANGERRGNRAINDIMRLHPDSC